MDKLTYNSFNVTIGDFIVTSNFVPPNFKLSSVNFPFLLNVTLENVYLKIRGNS
jgi:hypothetical protein